MAFTRPKAAQIDFDITNITDPLIRLNSGQSGANDKDVGIVIERGDDTNVAVLYDESADQFVLVNTTEDGSTIGNVTISSYAGLQANAIVYGSLNDGTTTLTATATELNLLDGVTGITLGSANELLIVGSDGTSIISDSTLSIDTGSNYIGINQTSPEVTLHMTGEGAQTAQIRMEQYNDSADAPDIRTRRYRGTIASPAAVQSGDYLFRSNHEYYNGTSLLVGGAFAFDNTNNAARTQFSVAVDTDGTGADPQGTNGQFKIDGNDGGAITFNNAYKFPTSDGSANQILATDGSGVLSFTGSPTFTGLTVDTNTLYVDAGNNRVGIGTTSPAYQVEIENTGANALLVLDRTDGAATFIEGGATASVIGSVGANDVEIAYNSFAVVTIGANGAITVNPDGDGFTFPTTDGSANQVLATNGSGTLSFVDQTGGGGSGHTIQNAGSSLTDRANLNFDGTYLVATDDAGNNQTDVTIGSGVVTTTGTQTLTNKTIASPTFTGTPAAPTAASGTNTTQIATTAFVSTAVSNLVDSAPGTLDTLNELAAALGDDANFSTTVTDSIATKLPLAGGTMTGNIVMSGAQTVDGRDLSVDGAKLDGIESGATADQTASEILTAIKTVDGAGSGLDADLLDGISSASFLRSDTSDSITSGSLTLDAGNITVNNGTNLQVLLNASDGAIEITRAAGGAYIDFKNSTAEDNDARLQESGGSINLNGNRILTTADEGSGNGIDADTVDGIQGASFLRSDTADTATGVITLNDDLVFANRTTTDGHIQLYGGSGATGYAIGIEGSTLYNRSGSLHRWYIGTYADAGTSDYMELSTSGLTVNGTVTATDVDISNSLDIGNEVVLTESTDRGDLLLIKSTTSSWGGIQISNSSNEGLWSFMTDGATGGIYDDQNNKWQIQFVENSETRLYHNGVEKLNTDSGGVTVAGVMTGTATSARYADLAERYEADAEYPTGTVMIFGGEKEVTQSTSKMDRRKAGVVSEKPAYMMNSDLVETVEYAPYIALQGRVPVRVIGAVRKGDLMITSSLPGCAEAWREEGDPRYGSVIGKSLVNKISSEEELIEIVVGVV